MHILIPDLKIAAAALPAILVPLPTATDDHQRKNAEVIARAGGAEVIEERELTGERLAQAILALAADPARRMRMAEAMQAFARPDAAERIADRVWALAGAAGTEQAEGSGSNRAR